MKWKILYIVLISLTMSIHTQVTARYWETVGPYFDLLNGLQVIIIGLLLLKLFWTTIEDANGKYRLELERERMKALKDWEKELKEMRVKYFGPEKNK